MAIEYVGGKSDTTGGSTSGNYDISLAAGLSGGIASSVSPGDLVIASFAVGSLVNRSLSISDGSTDYTLIGSELNAADSFDTNLRVAYKFMPDPVDSEVRFGPSGSNDDARAFTIQVFRGVDPTTPLDVAAVTATGTSSAKANPPSITPSTSGAFVVCVGAAAHDTSVGQLTSSDLTDYMNEISNDVRDVSIGAGHHAWTSGAFDAAQFGFSTSDSTSYSWCAVSLALRPATSNEYDIAADATSYALTISAASLEFGREVAADATSYSLTVQSATLAYFAEITPETASYAIGAGSATLVYATDYAIFAEPVSYDLSAQEALLLYTTDFAIAAEPAAFALAGSSASLEYGRELSAVGTSFMFGGSPATLRYSANRRRRVINAINY